MFKTQLCGRPKDRNNTNIIEPPRGKTNNVVSEQV